MNRKLKTATLINLLLLAAASSSGCAYFNTTQIEERDETLTKITTKATGYTLFSAKSSLANWKAEQSEGKQGAEVGGLTQQGATNTVEVIDALKGLIEAARP